jgi:spore germination cell wall hydrolase CwlJ-like protein
MALALYFEARSESIDAQLAVAEVILNRVEDTRFPDDVCSVVWQPKQFSWTHDGLSDTPKNIEVWHEIKSLSSDVLSDPEGMLLGHGADHYHAEYVKPYWAEHLTYVGKYETHVFYEWEH